MRQTRSRATQGGVALIIGLVILIIMTLATLSAVNMSTSNVKATANMQFRDAAFAAANVAIEQVVSTSFSNTPAEVTVNVDMQQYGGADYVVVVPEPYCNSWSTPNSSDLDPTDPADLPCFSGSRLTGVGGGTSSFCADTLWEVRAPVTDAQTGAVLTVNQGIKTRMSVDLARNACD